MKKKVINKKLQLNKETIAKMDQNGLSNAKGGAMGFPTTGCSDGCSLAKTYVRCTHGGCTDQCGNDDCGWLTVGL